MKKTELTIGPLTQDKDTYRRVDLDLKTLRKKLDLNGLLSTSYIQRPQTYCFFNFGDILAYIPFPDLCNHHLILYAKVVRICNRNNSRKC